MNDDRSVSTMTLVLAFAGGALLGAGAALLLAPQSGRKTRRQLGDLADDAVEQAQEMGHDVAQGMEKARQRGEQWAGQAKEFVDEKKAQVASILENARR